ncbi:MAG: hypothetical protein IJX18_01705 [Clostridia bacterium]|nr:hypothetical protein [Clostridia bacterium]
MDLIYDGWGGGIRAFADYAIRYIIKKGKTLAPARGSTLESLLIAV